MIKLLSNQLQFHLFFHPHLSLSNTNILPSQYSLMKEKLGVLWIEPRKLTGAEEGGNNR